MVDLWLMSSSERFAGQVTGVLQHTLNGGRSADGCSFALLNSSVCGGTKSAFSTLRFPEIQGLSVRLALTKLRLAAKRQILEEIA